MFSAKDVFQRKDPEGRKINTEGAATGLQIAADVIDSPVSDAAARGAAMGAALKKSRENRRKGKKEG